MVWSGPMVRSKISFKEHPVVKALMCFPSRLRIRSGFFDPRLPCDLQAGRGRQHIYWLVIQMLESPEVSLHGRFVDAF